MSFCEVDNRQEAAECINSKLNKIKNWSNQWLVTFLPPKTKSLTISKRDRHEHPPIHFNNIPIAEVHTHCYLGNNVESNAHIDNVTVKASQRTNMMIPLKY